MPARLVYAPKAWVYTKDISGTIHDLSNYCVSGTVDRKVNQVSTAQVTLRNPMKVFTTPSKGAPFHPMDPITIYLERVPGFPIRVFTGYLDQTPYYQMYPGAITLTASCTLKRLLYTFFDPSLPYVESFLEQYGWYTTGTGTLFSAKTLAGQNQGSTSLKDVESGKRPFTDLQDGSIGKLLWATLYNMGQWEDTNIWIEPLPSGANGVAARMSQLMQQINSTNQAAAQSLSTFLTQVVGAGGYGTGGNNATSGTGGAVGSGNIKSPAGLTVKMAPATQANVDVANTLLDVGVQMKANRVAMEAIIFDGIFESGLIDDGGLTLGGISVPSATVTQVAQDWYTGNGGFHGAGQGGLYLSQQPGSQWQDPAYVGINTTVPSPFNNTSASWPLSLDNNQYDDETMSNGDTGITAINDVRSEAIAWVNAYANGASGGNPTNTAANSTTVSGGTVTHGINATTASAASAHIASTTKGTKKSASGTSNTAASTSTGIPVGNPTASDGGDPLILNIFPAGTSGTLERTDQGVDFSFPAGTKIGAFGSGKFVARSVPDWFAGQPLGMVVLDSPVTVGGHTYNAWYMAEQWEPDDSLNGQHVNAGQQIGAVAPSGTGLETGWADAATGQQAAADSQFPPFDGSNPTVCGTDFANTIGVPVLDNTSLSFTVKGTGPAGSAVAGATAGSASSGAGSSSGSGSNGAQAFTASVAFPSLEDTVTAMLLGNEHRGLMHDQSLMPFVQQLTQASMRSFQSLPNGDFYAFYPDYFGEMGQHDPYWYIADIEVLNGGISLTDDSLVTHMFAIGDNTYPVNNELMNELFSAGVISIFNAFLDQNILDPGAPPPGSGKQTATNAKPANPAGSEGNIMTTAEAVEFIKRYGARPLVQDYPMVRSTIYEMLLAYQQFLLAWSNQFLTPFTFTFMPELFPGGKVGFPDHGLQMYINEVTHSWNYEEGGFTTNATLSAPSLLAGATSNPDLPPNMISALVEPIRGYVGDFQPVQAPNPTPPQSTNARQGHNIPSKLRNPNESA